MLTNAHKAGRQAGRLRRVVCICFFKHSVLSSRRLSLLAENANPMHHWVMPPSSNTVMSSNNSHFLFRSYDRTQYIVHAGCLACLTVFCNWKRCVVRDVKRNESALRSKRYYLYYMYNTIIIYTYIGRAHSIRLSLCFPHVSLMRVSGNRKKYTNQPNLDREKYVSIVGFYTICVMVLWSTGSQVLLLFIADIQTATCLTETTSQLRLMVNLMAFNGLSFSLLLSPFS